MAGKGRRYRFHGAFRTKAHARRKERARSGAFIKRVKIRHHTRYLVLTER